MKRYLIKIFLILTLVLIAPGCYTVIWTPDEEFPTERDYEYQGYYPDNYYGDYYYFYDYPWWLTITPPEYTGAGSTGNGRSNETTRTRNNEGGRSTDRGNTDNGNIIKANSPTRDKSSDNNNSGSTTTSSSDNNSSSSSRTETERSRGSNNNSGSGSSRNNDGGRSTGGRR